MPLDIYWLFIIDSSFHGRELGIHYGQAYTDASGAFHDTNGTINMIT